MPLCYTPPMPKPPKPKLVWWNVSLIGGKRATPLGSVQAPEGDAEAAMKAAIEDNPHLSPADRKRLAVRQA
jgi:hypothetical protein